MELGTQCRVIRLTLLLVIDATVVGRNSSKSDSINGRLIMTIYSLTGQGDMTTDLQ